MRDDGAGPTPASLVRELARGRLGEEDIDVSRMAGIIRDDDVAEVVSAREEMYDPAVAAQWVDDPPSTYWATAEGRRILRRHGTRTATAALETGNPDLIDYLTGIPNFAADISGLESIQQLREWITRTAGITLVSGHMGSGKTDMALLLGQIWRRETGGDIASNIASAQGVDTVTSMSDLEAALEADGETMMIWDEASSHASGYSSDQHQVESQLRRMLRMIRKRGGNLIMIGHAEGGRDIHPDVRRLSEAIYKTAKKTATVYEGIDERGEYENEKMSLSGIPPTDIAFDTREESSWEWDLDDEDDEDEEPDAATDQCVAETSSGDRCGVTAPARIDDTGLCDVHRRGELEDVDIADGVAEVPDALQNLQ